ncbi:MAG: hypothetical protein AAGA62_16745 [Bacteroidota bacterium]
MPVFPNLRLIAEGKNDLLQAAGIDFSAQHDLLVLYDEDLPFVQRVLKAAGYTEEDFHAVHWEKGTALNLSLLLRQLNVSKIILFGQDLPTLGLHLQVATNFPVTLAGRTYLVAAPIASITSAKAKGDNGPAAALWRALQQGLLKDQ